MVNKYGKKTLDGFKTLMFRPDSDPSKFKKPDPKSFQKPDPDTIKTDPDPDP